MLKAYKIRNILYVSNKFHAITVVAGTFRPLIRLFYISEV